MSKETVARLARVMQYCMERSERYGGCSTERGRQWYNAAKAIWLALPAGFEVNA